MGEDELGEEGEGGSGEVGVPAMLVFLCNTFGTFCGFVLFFLQSS